MADSASKPSESDFHDSHPLDDDLSPTLGDLSDLDSLPETASESKSVGDIESVMTPDEDDVLGDITLLEEAFAEMDEDSDEEASAENSAGDSALEGLLDDSDIAAIDEAEVSEQTNSASAEEEKEVSIPVLNEKVDEPTSNSEPVSVEANEDQSIPVLEEQATAMAEADTDEADDSALAHLLDDEATSDSMGDASVFVGSEEEVVSNMEQYASNPTAFSEITSDSGVQTAVDVLSDSDIEDVDNLEVSTETVDDKVAQFTADDSQSEINEIPAIDPYSGISTDFAKGLEDSVPLSTVISKFEGDESESRPTHAEHKVSVGRSSGFSLNIPFELHSQLSKKIDELVIDATTSLTNELNDQLSDKLEDLLQKSVEAVLPSLANQMINGLRSEIKQRVNEQLPLIINDVLGKTSLKDK